MIIVPVGTPWLRIRRDIPTMEQPAERYGVIPGRIHPALLWPAPSRRAFDMLCEPAVSRFASASERRFARPLDHAGVSG